VETGKIKLVFMDFPLPMHSHAMMAAEAAHCAGDQGKYWEMHDKIFENQRAISQEDLVKDAASLGLDQAKFKECLDSGKHQDQIKKDMAEGRKAGITGTPSFLVGYPESGDKVKAVKKIVGAQPYSAFKSAIDELLTPSKK
jgi:protein-disulfide isomerase